MNRSNSFRLPFWMLTTSCSTPMVACEGPAGASAARLAAARKPPVRIGQYGQRRPPPTTRYMSLRLAPGLSAWDPRLSADSREDLGRGGELAAAVFRAEIDRGPGACRELFLHDLR